MHGLRFATKKKVKEIEGRLDTFANLEHVNTLKNILLPKVQAFSDQLASYINDHLDMK
jgi:hypothetical protein